MTVKNYQFWVYYSAAWLFYALSLGAVFVGQGDSFGANLFFSVLCNVAPAFLLGFLVVYFCKIYTWSNRKKLRFVFIHILAGLFYAASWGFLGLVCLSIWVSIRDGEWQFNWWGNYALQWQFLSGLMAYFTMVSAVYVRQVNESLQAEERRNAELEMRTIRAESARQQAELTAIRSQLNPHFLFNTLHSLMALVRTDSAAAEAAIEQFAQMLRYVLQSQSASNFANSDVLFADEWEFIETYLKLENLRLGARLKVNTDIESAAFDCRVPAFLLQPLIENAIKWAISPRLVGGEICVKVAVENDFLKITVKDNGAGTMVENALNAKGFGLRLIREVLATRYGEAANLTIETAPNQGFSANLRLPANR
jgi:sensor histidine kinase YesM